MGKRAKQIAKPIPKAQPVAQDRWPVLAPAILFSATLICYWVQLTSSSVSPLWDAADFFRPIQDYLSHELHAGRIPFWTPYPFAGFPFLADPQVGAWYPLNWPFFLAGVTPRVLFTEHLLHALIACAGAYLLALRFLGQRASAALAGLCYGLSGFFTAHSSHTVILQTAAWLPWLLWLFDRAMESGLARDLVFGGFVAGLIVLAGHFQSALYCFFALALFAAARCVAMPSRWKRILLMALALPLIGTALSAIAVLPGLELATHSTRTEQQAARDNYGFIPPNALITLVAPDYFGAASDNYHGPADITQYYYYGGLLLVPLAIWGLWNRKLRLPCAVVFLGMLWYGLGPSGGLFLLIARLPGFASVRAPANGWFVPALALALLAGAGAERAMTRWRVPWLGAVLLALFAGDLFYCNFANNQLAYSRTSYEQLYGQGEDLFRRATVALPPLMRFDAAQETPAFGPWAHYFDTRTEVTYGYNPLTLSSYHDFFAAMQSNLALRNDLGGALWLEATAGTVRTNGAALPRVNFPRELISAASAEDSRKLLLTLDPARQAIVPANIHIAAQDVNANARVIEYSPGFYKIHFRAASESVLRISSAYFEGWNAIRNGQALSVFPIDHALMGIVVPAGESDLSVIYSSKYFGTGAVITAVSLILLIALAKFTRSPVQ